MTIFQVASALFAAVMIYIVSLHYKKNTLSLVECGVWVITWVSFMILALFPNLLLGVVHVLEFDRVFDLLVVVALMILSFLVFWNYFSHKAAQKKLENFVRKLAVTEASEKAVHGKKK